MKTIFTISILICSQFFLLGQSEKSDNTKIQVVNDYLNYAFNEELEKQKSLMHPDIIDYHPTVLIEPAKGREELIKGWQGTTAAMDSVTYKNIGVGILTIPKGGLSGEWVVTTGILTSKFKGIETPVSSQMVGFYKVEDGLIKEVRNFGNILDIYQQLGYTLAPPKQ